MELHFLFFLLLIESNYCRTMWNMFRTDRRNTGSPGGVSYLQKRLCKVKEMEALWQPILCANTNTLFIVNSLPKTIVCHILFGDTITESKR